MNTSRDPVKVFDTSDNKQIYGEWISQAFPDDDFKPLALGIIKNILLRPEYTTIIRDQSARGHVVSVCVIEAVPHEIRTDLAQVLYYYYRRENMKRRNRHGKTN